LINNRQTGRRRGRNNPRQNGGGNRGNGDSGNRIDNRARGNATQLLEKYRNMARDAQMAGDRVNAEYYLQFADHYFRVLADNRARQEEQQGRFRRPDDNEQDEEFADDGGDFAMPGDNGRSFDPQRGQGYGGYNAQRAEPVVADANNDEGEQPAVERGGYEQRAESPVRERSPRPRRPRREPTDAPVASEAEAPTFDAALLPPSIGRAVDSADEGDSAPAPKRTRRPRPSAQAAE
jgi:hypothetical protein